MVKVGTPLAITNAFSIANERKKEGKGARQYDFVPDGEDLISLATLQGWCKNEGLSFTYAVAVRCAVRDAYKADKRGHDLALAAYAKIEKLLEITAERERRASNADRATTVYRTHS
jgi:hypothetical protein